KDGGRGAAAACAKRAQLPEVGDLARTVGDTAAKTEAKRRGDEMPGEPVRCTSPDVVRRDRAGQVWPLATFDPERIGLEPVGRHTAQLLRGLLWPRLAGGKVQVPVAFIGAVATIGDFASLEENSLICLALADGVVLLAALAAEGQRQQRSSTVFAGDKL